MGAKLSVDMENLRCELTEQEVAERSRELATSIENTERAKLEHANRTKAHNADMAAESKHQSELARMVRDRATYRWVRVSAERNEEAQTVEYTREDTGEVFRSRPFSPDEKQLILLDSARSEKAAAEGGEKKKVRGRRNKKKDEPAPLKVAE